MVEVLPLTNILVELGMRDYLNEPKPDFLLAPADDVDQRMNRSVLLSETTAERLCTAVFEELLTRRLRRDAALSPPGPIRNA
ncbi:hypothetical protein G4G28_22810 [Massilia sp. Dwa41.01b]|uniref:hypothetical protein n=1 Tax=unclassified Massilia TaxID=2609279 RepID=UPI0016034756|nr:MULTISPECIES: hypothetical protein [unclassified Massilia]QNA90632.1 hypothetical protein G4G28_22810 [Massilia sp. Dwa41.01b]QNA97862.1 hypothetical protein G4G31_01880 [Massilia sp. Se16.2.3]